MIIDSLTNAERYAQLHPRFAKAFEWIKNQNLETIEVGKYPIDGPELHASVSQKDGYTRDTAKFECHNNWIDIQVCPTGKEQQGWTARERVTTPAGEYNAEKDVTFFTDKPETYFTLQAGQFVIYWPEDVHAPQIGEGPIKKLVVKVKI
ncbi:YhcH/YjgK/YiaL family protein [Aridibaculum aurantiacum]|uniref:YhcH/YjgK/YiaL family protein n=1 Tax=Aridibaculum aurantiacum TaxID=2810307 RepID=UPI001A965C1C|nr:YhcH/YjgK/YiaL family protein [Aridibaculum aurantiacum]